MRWGVKARGPLYIYSPGRDHMVNHMLLFTIIYYTTLWTEVRCFDGTLLVDSAIVFQVEMRNGDAVGCV